MRVPVSWLREFVEFSLSIEEVAERLTIAGLEVDAIEKCGPGFSGVVAAEVIETAPHPEADRLKLAKVSDGSEIYDLVCGAPNCRKGMKVALAKVGAVLPDGEGGEWKLKKSKIRGVPSHGMLCAWDELGLGERQEGIAELGAEIPLGLDLAESYGDTVLEISLTPNLAHCFSVYGVARELGGLLNVQSRYPEVVPGAKTQGTIEDFISVRIEDTERCPRYCCRVLTDVKVGASPDWLQERLKLAGLRPVNNVVDVTNYVMWELGQPMHAFDHQQISGNEIIVRTASEGEQFKTLDDVDHVLSDEELVICDANRAIAIGGVMGGANSEVSEQTNTVVLESAFFAPRTVRRSSRRLGITSESSKRFERGCDPNNTIRALDRAVSLLSQIAGAVPAEGVIDVGVGEFPRREVSVRFERINGLLGTELVKGEVEQLLNQMDLQPAWESDGLLTVQVPTYRHDLQIEEEVIEEIARLNGYDNIPVSRAKYHSAAQPHAPQYLFEKQVRSRLVAEGLQELMCADLISAEMAREVPGSTLGGQVIEVLNPVSQEQSVLRPSLLPGLLDVIKYNADRGHANIAGFELGRVYQKQDEKYVEELVLGIVMVGSAQPAHWSSSQREADIFDVKGLIENLCASLLMPERTYGPLQLDCFHPGRQAAIHIGDNQIGVLGEVHPVLNRKIDLSGRVLFAEINMQSLFTQMQSPSAMEPLPQFPGSVRDWTIALGADSTVGQIVSTLRGQSSKLLESVEVRDVYEDAKLGKGVRNVTFRLKYRSPKKTLSQEAVEREHERLIANTTKALEK